MEHNAVYKHLHRHFLQRFFENELVSPQGELRTGFAGMLALVATPSLLIPCLLIEKYSTLIAFIRMQRFVDRDGATLSDKVLLLALAFVIPALAALLKWETLFLDHDDHSILVPLPIRLRTIFLAKAAALGAFVLMFAAAVNAPAIVIYPLIVLGDTGTLADALRYFASHAIAGLCAGIFGAAAVIAVQGIGLALLGGAFRRISAAIQFALLTFLLAQLLLAPRIGSVAKSVVASPNLVWHLFPPVWFTGLYELALGKTANGLVALGGIAILATVIAVLVAAVSYVAGYARTFRRLPELGGMTHLHAGWREGVAGRLRGRLVRGHPGRAAVLDFVFLTLSRSRTHRLLLAAFLGIAASFVLEGLTVQLLFGATVQAAELSLFYLAVPLIVSFFLLVSLRFLYEVPAELNANWIFQLAEPPRPGVLLDGASLAITTIAAPLLIVAVPALAITMWGAALGAAHAAWCLLLAIVLREALLVGYAKIPFTCSFGAAKWNVVLALMIWWLIFLAYTWMAVRLEAIVLRNVYVFHCACLILVGVGVALFRRRRRAWSEARALQFVDGREPAVQTLDLFE